MACADCTQTVPCSPTDPCSEACADTLHTGCVITQDDIGAPIDIDKGNTLTDVLEKIRSILADLSPSNFENFDYGCFNSQGIETEQEFAEFVANVLCQILGTQVPGSITSLSELRALIQTLQTQMATVLTQNTLGCFQTLSGAAASLPLNSLLSTIQQVLCDHESDILSLATTADSPSITVNNTNRSVIITATGSKNHSLFADVSLSAAVGQALIQNPDGTLFVQDDTLLTNNPSTTTVVTLTGTKNHTIKVDAKISANVGNILIDDGAGLFVPSAALAETPLVASDSATIDFSTSGTNGHNLTGSVKLDPAPTNVIVQTGSGLLVDSSSLPATSQTPITPIDTQSVDLTTAGIDNHTLSAQVKINPTVDNPIYIAAGGLEFDDIKAITRIVNNSAALAVLCSAIAACAMPTINMNCAGATVPGSFISGTASSDTLIIPVSVTGSGNITVTANGSGLSGSNVVAVNGSTASISLNLNYDGSAPSGVRSIIINIAGAATPESCNINVTINPSSNIELQSTLAGTTVTDVTGISGYTFSGGPMGPGETRTGTHTGGTFTVNVTVTGPPVINGNIRLKRNGTSIDCQALTTGGGYPVTINFPPTVYVVGDLLEVDLGGGNCV